MSVRNKPVKYTYANYVSSVGKALHRYRRGHGFKSLMTWTFRALFSLLRRSLSYSFLNLQFPYMIFIYSHLSIFISVLHTRTSAAKYERNFFAFINRTQKAIIHSTQVQAVQYGTHPKICVATFYTGFGVDANSYITSYVTGK